MTTRTLTPADAEALAASFLEARRAKHADFRMDATNGGDGGNDDGGSDGGSNGNGNDDGGKPDDKPKTPEEQLAELTAQLEDLKRNSRKWENRAKENKDAKAELDRLKAEGMDDGQKLQAAEERAQKAERALARYRVAADTGLPADLAEMLTGEDEDAMTEQAKRLLARLAPAKKNDPPKPDPSQGGSDRKDRPSQKDVGLEEARRRFGDRDRKKN